MSYTVHEYFFFFFLLQLQLPLRSIGCKCEDTAIVANPAVCIIFLTEFLKGPKDIAHIDLQINTIFSQYVSCFFLFSLALCLQS